MIVMRKSSTPLFILFIALILAMLVFVNFFKDSAHLNVLGTLVVPTISVSLMLLIILSFTFREYETNRIQNEFITIVTHKFRTPLTGIRWTIDMLQKDLTLLEKKDLLMEMQKANERLMEIVDLLVGFAKFDKNLGYAFEAVSLREIVSTSLSKYTAMAKNKNIQFSLESDKELPMLIIDKSKIQFVVDMLIDNALKYTPKEGSVLVGYALNDRSVVLKVKDTGIGMGFLDSKRVFKHFFRSHSAKLMDTEGLGLGLYTARKIVRHHHGRLWASSEGENKGSTFFLQLPIKR